MLEHNIKKKKNERKKKNIQHFPLFPPQPKHACTHIVFKALIPCLSGNTSDMKVIVLQLQCQACSRFLFWNLRGCYKALQTLTCFCQCTAAEDLARAQLHSQPSLYLSRPFAQFSLTSTYNRHTEHTQKEEISVINRKVLFIMLNHLNDHCSWALLNIPFTLPLVSILHLRSFSQIS